MSALFPAEINASGFGGESFFEVSGLLRGHKSEGGRFQKKLRKRKKAGEKSSEANRSSRCRDCREERGAKEAVKKKNNGKKDKRNDFLKKNSKNRKKGGGRGGEKEKGRSGAEGVRQCRYGKKRSSAEIRASVDRERSNQRII